VTDILGALVVVGLIALAIVQLAKWLLRQAGGLLMTWILRNC
jgi:hypothetical protein